MNLNKTGPQVSYYENYNFQNETWWPKFEQLKSRFNINVVKGDKTHKSRAANRIKSPNGNQINTNNNINNSSSNFQNNITAIKNNLNQSNQNNEIKNKNENAVVK